MGSQAKINKQRKETLRAVEPNGQPQIPEEMMAQLLNTDQYFMPPEYLNVIGGQQITDSERRFAKEVARLEMLLMSERNRSALLAQAYRQATGRKPPVPESVPEPSDDATA